MGAMSDETTLASPKRANSQVDRLAMAVATGAGIGLVMPAPGTWGALLGLALAWFLSICLSPTQAWLAVAALCALGVPICTRASRILGSGDPSSVIWDETASVPIVFCLVPLRAGLAVAIVGLILHRIFDIAKPPPIRHIERWPAGLGIMADDWMAAAYAAIALWCVVALDAELGWQLISDSGA